MARGKKKIARPRAGAWRTCVACRQPVSRARSLRLVRDPQGLLRPDFSGRLPGRGLHLCPQRGCLLTACQRQVGARGFPAPTRWPDGQDLLETWLRHLLGRAQALLALCRSGGWLVSGRSAVISCLRQRRAALVLVASDAGRSLIRDIQNQSRKAHLPVWNAIDSQRLNEPLSGRRVNALAIVHRGLAAKLRLVLEKLTLLEGRETPPGLTEAVTKVKMPGRRKYNGGSRTTGRCTHVEDARV